MEMYFGFAAQLLEAGLAEAQDPYGPQNSYDTTVAFDDDVPFYTQLASVYSDPVLDLGCGTGRVLLPLSQQGFQVTGVDQSASMLRECRYKLEAYGLTADIVEQDMRSFDFPGLQFGLIIIPYCSMIYMVDDDARQQVLRRVYRHLRPGGGFAFDFQASPVETGDSRPWLGLQAIDPLRGDVIVQVVQMRGLSEDKRLINQINYRHGRSTIAISVQASLEGTIPAARMAHLLETTGFQVKGIYGDFANHPYTSGEQCVILAEKPLQAGE